MVLFRAGKPGVLYCSLSKYRFLGVYSMENRVYSSLSKYRFSVVYSMENQGVGRITSSTMAMRQADVRVDAKYLLKSLFLGVIRLQL
jgi:hypothetical protein